MEGAGKEITVTGATGTLGRRVVDRLLERGDRVRALSRNPPADDRSGLDWVVGDLSAEAGMDDAFDGVDAVLHCATNSRSPKQDVAGARNLIDVLAAQQTPLIYISIVGVDRIPFGYYRIKRQAEELIEGSGLPWTILRATQFHDLLAGVIARLALAPVLLPVPAGFSFQPVDAGEVAGRLVELADRPGAGRVPDFGGPEVLPAAELARLWLRHQGKRRRVVNLPLPGKAAAAFRAGDHLAPENRAGTVTFRDYLAAG